MSDAKGECPQITPESLRHMAKCMDATPRPLDMSLRFGVVDRAAVAWGFLHKDEVDRLEITVFRDEPNQWARFLMSDVEAECLAKSILEFVAQRRESRRQAKAKDQGPK